MKLDTFTKAYIEAIIFTECHCDNPELDGKTFEDFSDDAKQKIIADCEKFQSENDLTDYPSKNAGHDFWLTRNHHGCGFWENDFGNEEQCKKLTESAHKFGEQYVYCGDNGKVYL